MSDTYECAFCGQQHRYGKLRGCAPDEEVITHLRAQLAAAQTELERERKRMYRVSIQWGKGMEYWVSGLLSDKPDPKTFQPFRVARRGALPKLKIYQLVDEHKINRQGMIDATK